MSLKGFLAPAAPWTAGLIGVASKAVIVLHADGAAIAVVGTEENADARAFVMAEGFSEFARAAESAIASEDPGAAGGTTAEQGAAEVRFDGDCLCVIGRNGKTLAAADAGSAATWDPRCRLASASPAAGSAALGDAADCIEEALGEARASGRTRDGIHGDGPFAAAFLRLKTAPGFPASLVGFGPGSTPAGDDWLAGYLAGRDLLEGGPGTAEPAVRAAVAGALRRTTPAGRALLRGALAGAPPAYLVRLALAAASGGKDRVREAVLAALTHGATSGEDTIGGFLAAMRGAAAAEVAGTAPMLYDRNGTT